MSCSRVNVWIAYLLGNRRGKRVDVNGRTYRSVYREYGNAVMAHDFLHGNSWHVKQRVGLI